MNVRASPSQPMDSKLATTLAPIPTLAASFHAGSESPERLLDEVYQRIAAFNGSINAYVHLNEADARKSARASSRRWELGRPLSKLDGIPVAIKDNLDVAGLPTSNGIAKLRNAQTDAQVVAQLRRLGAVIVGKVNMHEAALGTITDNPHFGVTHNPLRVGHTAGGPSGGSAAAVVSGMCSFALGTDTLGSVRLPAAFCGLYGLKPTHGAISSFGLIPLEPTLDCVGPIVGDMQSLRTASQALLQLSSVSLERPPRFGVIDELADVDQSERLQQVWPETLKRVKSLGSLQRVSIPSFDAQRLRRACLILVEHALARDLPYEWRVRLSPQVAPMADYGERVTPEKVEASRVYLDTVRGETAAVFAEVDALVMPTAGQAAFEWAREAPAGLADFLALPSAASLPSVSLPIGLATQGDTLPLAMQVVTSRGTDALALDLAAQIDETLQGWSEA